MKITFKEPKEIVIVKEVKRTFEELVIQEIVDLNSAKLVTAHIEGLGAIILWEGESYDAIGQWTDADVETKILELYQ